MVSILVVWKFEERILRWERLFATNLALGLVGVGVVFAIGNFFLFNYCSIPATGDFRGQGTVFFPLWLDKDVAQLGAKVDGDRAKLVNTFGPVDINDRLSVQGVTLAKVVTFFAFLVLYEGVFICWTMAFVILSLREKPPPQPSMVQKGG